jgi:hypothetical protein
MQGAVLGADVRTLTVNQGRLLRSALLLAHIHPGAWKVFSEIQGMQEPGLN